MRWLFDVPGAGPVEAKTFASTGRTGMPVKAQVFDPVSSKLIWTRRDSAYTIPSYKMTGPPSNDHI